MQRPFRILALSGGGVRGVFQAVYLAKLRERLGSPLRDHFDLIAGTSTGALIGLAISLDVAPERIVDFYKTEAPAIFHARRLAGWRRGARYDHERLRSAATRLFQVRRLSDGRPAVMITAASLDRFSYRLFSTLGGNGGGDGDLLASDVALASAAAPTYFPPVKPLGQERSYVDGGLWANSPALVAALTVHQQEGVAFSSMRLLSVGNGEFPRGVPADQFARYRPFSLATGNALFEVMFATQESFANEYVLRLLTPGHFLHVTTELDEPLPLDATSKALEQLPKLAEAEFERTRQSVLDLLSLPPSAATLPAHPANAPPRQYVPRHLIEAAGLSAFYPSRAFYADRRGAASIDRYVATARSSLVMVSINLMTGVPFDGLLDVLERKLGTKDACFTATISLLNPRRQPLMEAVAPVLSLTPAELAGVITQTSQKLLHFRRSLSAAAQTRLTLKLHDAVPFGSAILIDHSEPDGRIQIETKAYKAPVRKSFAFEVFRTGGEEDLYDTLLQAYQQLIADGCEMSAVAL
ncbi:cGAMP-activated phospholipase [Planctomycetaceae bacterium]|nr:cGAMP-activated phospholipase [Planctomycetaceae bacterium]